MNWREFQMRQRVAEIGDRFVSYMKPVQIKVL